MRAPRGGNDSGRADEATPRRAGPWLGRAFAALLFALCTTRAARAEPPPPEAPLEVVVRGERRPTDVTSFTREEMRQLPGAFGDPFRAVEASPGVSPVISGFPYFFVRGAPPGNVGYFIDGIRVPLLYHWFVGPGVIHPAFIERVDLYRGAYPARYGRFAGAIVAAETVRPSYEVHGEASVRLIDTGAMLELPLGAADIRAAGRYSYTSLVLSLLSDAVLEYWDYQGVASYELGSRDTLTLFGFGAYDYAGNDNGEVLGSLEFHRLDLRYDHEFGDHTYARVALTLGLDRSRGDSGGLRDRMLGGRLEIGHQLDRTATLHVGADVSVDRFDVELEPTLSIAPELERYFGSRTDLTGGAYTELSLEPEPWFTLTPGVRLDFYRSRENSALAVDPRIRALFEVTEHVRVNHSLGIAHQPPTFAPPGIPAVQTAGLPGGLQRSVQASSGVELDLPEKFVASATLFDHIYFNVSDPIGTTGELDAQTVETRALGAGYGVELQLRRSLTSRVGGFVAYTLSRSTRDHDRLESLSAFDRTHVAQFALAIDLGRRWRAGARSMLLSGVPTRRPTPEGPRYLGSERAPAFARLDLRLEKRWRVGERAWWGVTAEVLNATGSREVVRRNCNEIRCTESGFGPLVLPSIGVEASF